MTHGIAFSTCMVACGLALSPLGSAQATTFRTLHVFASGADGASPEAGLIGDQAGNIYGTTFQGGAAHDGTVFKITAGGGETVLHSFEGGSDGRKPEAGLIGDEAGNLYGTTYSGGSNNCGTVFEIAPNGAETVLYSFRGGNDGENPEAGLIADSAGNLYGTTLVGGSGGFGTVFKLAPNGTETVLHTFAGGSDGEYPAAGVIADSSGNLYGTASSGGAHDSGSVYKLAPNGALTTLYAFAGGKDGAQPRAGLIADSAGNLYGTTQAGGGKGCDGTGCGTIFKLAPSGTETVLHAFAAGSDGAEPYAGLIADSAGNLYGTTVAGGGANGDGTIYRITANGALTGLYAFAGAADGRYPEGSLIIDKSGDLYGTAYSGGAHNWGTVFELEH
jgi:uncharacterized repeat protein (TIGR03803 family)